MLTAVVEIPVNLSSLALLSNIPNLLNAKYVLLLLLLRTRTNRAPTRRVGECPVFTTRTAVCTTYDVLLSEPCSVGDPPRLTKYSTIPLCPSRPVGGFPDVPNRRILDMFKSSQKDWQPGARRLATLCEREY